MAAQAYNNLLTGDAIRVHRATAVLPESTAEPIFTVSGGKILLCAIIGEVTVEIEAGANNAKLIANPTVGASVDLCALTDIDADAVGTMYSLTGFLADVLKATTSGAFEAQGTNIVVAPGTIDLSCSATKTGSVKWVLFFVPLDENSVVTAV